MTDPALPLGDYVSPNLARVLPDAAFPHMIVGTPAISTWSHLRRQIAHNWYVDRRAPTVGFVSRDEASILYNTALMLDSPASLEIGCWHGWSTVHIALGTHSLDAIDPILADPATRDDVTETLRRAGVLDRVSLVPFASPEGVERLASETGKRWSFAFIDGDHSGDAPLIDAEVVQRFATSDAIIILHDLAAPEPAAALAYLRDQGWTTAVYQTMQIMGVATRGRCRPVAHIPDPAQQWSLPEHLSSFAVIGESTGDTARRITVALGGSNRQASAQTEDDDARGRANVEEALIAAGRAARELRDTKILLEEARRALTALEREQEVRVVSTKHFDDLHARYVSLVDTLAAQRIAREALMTELAEAGQARDNALALRDEAISARDNALAERQRIQDDHTRLETLLDRSMRSLAAVDRRAITSQTQSEELTRLRTRLKQRGREYRRLQKDLLELRVVIDAQRAGEAASRAAEAFAHAICQPRVLFGLARRAVFGARGEVRRILGEAFVKCGSPIALPAPAAESLSRPRTLFGLLRRRLLAGGLATEGLLLKATRAHIRLDSNPKLSSEIAKADLKKTLAAGERRVKKARTRLAAEERRAQEAEQKAQETARKLQAVESALVAEERSLNEAQLELTRLRAVQRTETIASGAAPLKVAR
jgi:predicted O-methyltransferase YrrM